MSNTRVTRVVTRLGPSSTNPKVLYNSHQKEYWLSTDEFDYIRPGLNVTINSITNVGPGQKPVVDVSMTDDLGQPVDRKGVITPGAVGMEFIIAVYHPDTRVYTNYTSIPFAAGAPPTPLHDVGGTWQDIDVGHSVYTFGLPMPATLDVTQTTTVGIYANRQTAAIVGKDYSAPAVVQYFRPDGGTPSTAQWDTLDIGACNQCHNPLSMHGQFGPPIQDVKLCVTCHTPDFPLTATGKSLDFRVYIHKIHRGADLPSVQTGNPYVISPGNDFSTVVFPQDIRNCDTCHSGPNPPAGNANWYTYPAMAICGSCHDDVNFATGQNHDGGPQADDSQCASCHVIPAPGVYDGIDAPIQAAHWVPYKSDQLHGLNMTILSVSNVGPGKAPIVTYQITDKTGAPMDPRPFDTVQFTLGGPTTDYSATPISEDALATTTYNGNAATYSFVNAIPQNASGTWAMTADVEVATVITRPNALPPINFTESALNPVFYIAITDPEPVPRREVVNLANCDTCHDRLAAHGGRRLNTEACVICHNPDNNDSAQRPKAQNPPESISFQRMIHRIHTGENLTHDFTIYRYQGSVHNFNGVLFPGDRRDCQKCHTTDPSGVGTEQVSETPPPGLLPTLTSRDWYSPMQHYAAACLGCHDTQAAAAHAFTMTTPFDEACATCHAPGATFSVDQVHAR
jgi:OmcA/MtrC family decaheme c-type cytochrome